MALNFLKNKLAESKTVLGTWSIIDSPVVTEIFGKSGLDFQILDMEHGPFDLKTLGNCIRAAELTGCSPLVRVSSNDASKIQSALDLGAHGIVVPQVQGYEGAVEALKACKFPPEGTRGFNPFTRTGDFEGLATAPRLQNSFGLTCILVENLKSYEELDQILGLAALDVVYLGVYDMSAALGCMGQLSHPSVKNLLGDAIPRIRKAGKAVGMMVKSMDEVKLYTEMGANFLVYAVDSYLIRKATTDFVKQFAERAGA